MIHFLYGEEFQKANDSLFNATKDERMLETIKKYDLEKKEQQTAGSVDTKLLSGPAFKREYELALEGKFKIEYAYCLNEYFNKEFTSDSKKYKILGQILSENNIPTLFGDEEDYFGKLDAWIGL